MLAVHLIKTYCLPMLLYSCKMGGQTSRSVYSDAGLCLQHLTAVREVRFAMLL